METKQELYQKLAELESVHDQLLTELCYIDRLMHLVGFPGGLAALKETAKEFQERGDQYLDEIP
jgi:hypothetical protein